MLPRQHRVETFLHKPLARPRDGGEAGVQGFNDATIAPTLTRLGDIRLEQHTSLQDRGGGMFAFAGQLFQRRPFVLGQANNVFLNHGFRHIPIPDTIDDGAESQRANSKSMTVGTSEMLAR